MKKNAPKKYFFGAKKSHNRWFFRFFYLESHRIWLIYQLGALDGLRYTVWYATHEYISLYFLKWNKMTKKNVFRPVFLLFFRWNLFGSSQIPIRSSRWMNTCCLICDMTIFHWIFENTKMSPKITFWRRKITFLAVFPLYLIHLLDSKTEQCTAF